jgi:hypothetical protein
MSDVFLTVMKAKQPKSKKKAMTLDDFAVAIQKDYTALRKDMAAGFAHVREETKEQARQLRAEMGIGFRNLEADVKMMTDAMVSKADLANTLAEELAKSPYTRQIADLQTRVDVLESKLGIKPTRRAA